MRSSISGQVGEVEGIGEPRDPLGIEIGGQFLEREGEGNLPVRDTDVDGHAMVLDEKADLLLVVALEQGRFGQRGAVDAGLGYGAVRKRASGAPSGQRGHFEPQVGIAGVDLGPAPLSAHETSEVLLEEGAALGVDLPDSLDRRVGIVKRAEFP